MTGRVASASDRMPTYEYRCPEGHEFERFYRKISDASPQVECPECGKIAERKMSAGAGLLFKGSGFYLTDYGKNAHRGTQPAKADGGGEGGGDGGETLCETRGRGQASRQSGGVEGRAEDRHTEERQVIDAPSKIRAELAR